MRFRKPIFHLKRKFVYKVFRSTTRFKKFYFKRWSKFLRKSYRRRKHKTNWLVISTIFYVWVRYYLKYKHYLRYYQSVGLLCKQFYSTSFVLFKKQTPYLYSAEGFNLFSCSKKLITYFDFNVQHLNNNISQRFTNLSRVSCTGLQLTESDDTDNYDLINPGLIYYDKLYYSLSNFSTSISNLEISALAKTLFTVFNRTQFQFVLAIYLILTFLTIKVIYTQQLLIYDF